jgi:hypothetical protein
MHPVVRYILLYLADMNEDGWTEAPDSDPDHGAIVLVKGDEHLKFSHKFNGGDPQWFPTRSPKRLDDALYGLYPLRSPPKREGT